MTTTTISDGEFARDLAQAKHAAMTGPVFVTDQGKPAYALLKIEDYYKLANKPPRSLLDVMDSLVGGEGEFEPPRMDDMGLRPAELE